MDDCPRLSYRSFLAPLMRDYVHYLGQLGYACRKPAYDLRCIDRFLLEQRIEREEQLDAALLMRLVEQCQGRLQAATVSGYLRTFSGFCGYLVRRGRLQRNPVAGFPRPRPLPYQPYVFSPRQLQAFFRLLQGRASQASHPTALYRAALRYCLYHLLYACGLRASEGLGLRRQDFSPEEAALYVRPSKFGKDRLIPVSLRVCCNLGNLLALRRSLYPGMRSRRIFALQPSGRPFSLQEASRSFRRLMLQMGIYRPAFWRDGRRHGTPHLHELRRAFAVHRLLRWYRQGADLDAKLPLLATYMGHSCFEHTKAYLTLTRSLLDQAAGRFARFDRLDWIRRQPAQEEGSPL